MREREEEYRGGRQYREVEGAGVRGGQDLPLREGSTMMEDIEKGVNRIVKISALINTWLQTGTTKTFAETGHSLLCGLQKNVSDRCVRVLLVLSMSSHECNGITSLTITSRHNTEQTR